jgi:hypothetical protein
MSHYKAAGLQSQFEEGASGDRLLALRRNFLEAERFVKRAGVAHMAILDLQSSVFDPVVVSKRVCTVWGDLFNRPGCGFI